MRGKIRGFTLVEVVIVVAAIAILATIVAVALNRHLVETYDTQRNTNAEIIANALEKYYEQNGEYPGCEAITSPSNTLRANTLKDIDTAALLTPHAQDNSTNSIRCAPIEGTSEDIFSYTGDGSAACQTGPACASFVLAYREQATGDIVSIQSRHTAATLATRPTLTAEALGSNTVKADWTGVYNAVSYQMQRSTTAGFASVTTTAHTSKNTVINGLSPNTTYYLRVRAVLPSSAYSAWSDTVEVTTD